MIWITDRHDVCTCGEERRATILRLVCEKHHIMGSRREATVLDEEVANVHCIVDASVQLVFATKVVDTDDESLSSRHGCGVHGSDSQTGSSK